MTKNRIPIVLGILFLMVSCVSILAQSQHLQDSLNAKIALWEEATVAFVLKKEFTHSRSAKKYMKTACHVKEKDKSIREQLLNLINNHYENALTNSDFFIIENLTQHGTHFILIVDTEGDNWIRVNLLEGRLSAPEKQKKSFTAFENSYKKAKVFDYYSMSTSLRRNTILTKFEGNRIEMKMITEK